MLKPLLILAFATILPFLRVVHALDNLPSGSDTVSLSTGELDAIALVKLVKGLSPSYGVIFWDRYIVTVIEIPDKDLSRSDIYYLLKKNLSIQPVNTPNPISASSIETVQFILLSAPYYMVVAELNEIFEGLTTIKIPFEEGYLTFNSWLEQSNQKVVSAVIDQIENNQLLELPLTFDPETYNEISDLIIARHNGSALQDTRALEPFILPGMSCLGQNTEYNQLMLLGLKDDTSIFQYNQPNGEQWVEIPFQPFDYFIHIIATTAGLSQTVSNRWADEISPLTLTEGDILDFFELHSDESRGAYLCHSHCSAGSVPVGSDVCTTRKGKYKDFQVLEGRLEIWATEKNGNIPVNAMRVPSGGNCSTGDAICFVEQDKTLEFGGVVTGKGCDTGQQQGSYYFYFVPLIMSDGGATLDPGQQTSAPDISPENSTEDYTGATRVTEISNPGFTEPTQLTDAIGGGSDPDLAPTETPTSSSGTEILMIVIIGSVAGVSILAMAGFTAVYCIRRRSTCTRELDNPLPDSDSPPPTQRHHSAPAADGTSMELLTPRAETTETQFLRGIESQVTRIQQRPESGTIRHEAPISEAHQALLDVIESERETDVKVKAKP